MDINLVTDSKALAHTLNAVREKLHEGYVLVLGDEECVEMLMFRVYPPRSEESKQFELIIILSGDKVLGLGIAKKTKKLKELFAGLNEEKFSKLIVIQFTGREGSTCISKLVGAEENEINNAIEYFVNAIQSTVEGD